MDKQDKMTCNADAHEQIQQSESCFMRENNEMATLATLTVEEEQSANASSADSFSIMQPPVVQVFTTNSSKGKSHAYDSSTLNGSITISEDAIHAFPYFL